MVFVFNLFVIFGTVVFPFIELACSAVFYLMDTNIQYL